VWKHKDKILSVFICNLLSKQYSALVESAIRKWTLLRTGFRESDAYEITTLSVCPSVWPSLIIFKQLEDVYEIKQGGHQGQGDLDAIAYFLIP
jgi:hypothetical protein